MKKILWLILRIVIFIAFILALVSLEIRWEDVSIIMCWEMQPAAFSQDDIKPVFVDPPKVSRDKYASKTSS